MDRVRVKAREGTGVTKILPGGRRILPGQELVIPSEVYERIKGDPDIELVSVEVEEGIERSIDDIISDYEDVIKQKDELITSLQKEIASLRARIRELEVSAPIRSKAQEIASMPWRKRRSVVEGLSPDDDRDLLEALLEVLKSEKQTKSIEEDISIINLKLSQGNEDR